MIKKPFGSSWALALAVLCAAAIHGHAATFTVTNTNNSGVGSLRQAVLNANAAAGTDDIIFDASFNTPQTITLATVVTINGVNDTLTITGPGAHLLTISGNNLVRIFTISTGEITTISGITFTQAVTGAISNSGTLTVTDSIFNANTNSSNGGAIISSGLSLTVAGCTFTNNSSSIGGIGGGGGAIYNTATATITDSTFSNNMTTGGAGGGAITNAAVMIVTGSTFTGNTTTVDGQNSSGGAISGLNGSELTINNSVITGNSSVRNGGGIYSSPNSTPSSLSITNSTISNNIANSNSDTTGNGGGLYLSGAGSVTITGSTINDNTSRTGNTSTGRGGGIDVSVPTTITNSTVSGNTAQLNGGGIYASGTSGIIVNITNSTIVNNAAGINAGGVNRASSSNPVNFRNTIIANNIANGGTSPDVLGTVNSNGFNLIRNTTGAAFLPAPTDIIGVDPNLGFLQNNGGPTWTHAFLAGSPAIDKGHSSSATTDQRGLPRPFDHPAIPNAAGGDGADIGAFESDMLAPTFIVTNDADSGSGSLRDALMQANSNAQPDIIAFDPAFFATPRTIVLASEIEITADGTNPGQQLVIDGPGADLVTISGNNAIRPFHVAPNASVVMGGMTIRDGNGVGTDNSRAESGRR